MIKVSIIIPVYNSYEKIDKCIESIVNQSYKNIEVLLINDGSQDKTLLKLRKYEKKYSFIKVIDKENEGVSKTRNLGIKKSSGKYIMFIDNDDYIDKEYVEVYLKAIEEFDGDVVIGGFRRVDYNGKEKYRKILKNTYWSRYTLLHHGQEYIEERFY